MFGDFHTQHLFAIIVTLDADGSTDPAEIPAFIGALLAGADFAKGSPGRLVGEATYGQERPALAAAYGTRFAAAGWAGEVDTRGWEPGEHVLEARARSTASGTETSYVRRVALQ